MSETITIDKSHYKRLIEASEKLNALEAAGVDNWEGYSIALSMLEDEESYEDIYGVPDPR